MSALQLYGIRNCDTVRNARRWLEQRGCDYGFYDLRNGNLSAELLAGWCARLGYQQLLNKRSTSWRQLPESRKNDLDETRAIALMLETPTLIKRPVLLIRGQPHVGFSATQYQQLLGDEGESHE